MLGTLQPKIISRSALALAQVPFLCYIMLFRSQSEFKTSSLGTSPCLTRSLTMSVTKAHDIKPASMGNIMPE